MIYFIKKISLVQSIIGRHFDSKTQPNLSLTLYVSQDKLHVNIDPLPHQINLVHYILKTNNLNWLIADDVGLGKTIETGMLLHALRQRDQARRVLLVTPAGLTKQWKEEMYHKFHIDEFRIYGTDFFINEQRESIVEKNMAEFRIGEKTS